MVVQDQLRLSEAQFARANSNVVTQVILRLGFACGSLERRLVFKILGKIQRCSLKRREVRLGEHQRRKSGSCSLIVRLAYAWANGQIPILGNYEAVRLSDG